ncbi:MAG TPA: serine protease [Kofleriaceae bacterium]
MAIVAVVANAAGCPGLEVRYKQDQDQSQGQKQNQDTGGVGPHYLHGEACRDRPLRKVTVKDAVSPNIVRIATESGSGTGFVLASPKGELLVVTNAHVVGDEERISAVLATSSGERIEVPGLEVALDDPSHDLVILRAARTPGAPKGLYLNPAGVRLNQDVVALGYPAAAGATANLSFESGKISALAREVEGRTYLQTNVSINPGNTGGPVVDACGAVVGVITSIYSDARRVSLIVPGAHVLALHDRYLAPREIPSTRIRARTAMLENSIKLQKADDASEIFSRQFLRENVWGGFLQFLQRAKAQEERYAAEMRKTGMVYADEPFEKRAQFLSGLLPHDQFVAWYVEQAIALHLMSKYEGLHRYLAMSALFPNVFGALTSLRVVDVIKESEASAVARVQVVNKRGTKLYDFQWKLEWNDWHIAKLTCVSGCNR